jgi:hypothetical protein
VSLRHASLTATSVQVTDTDCSLWCSVGRDAHEQVGSHLALLVHFDPLLPQSVTSLHLRLCTPSL